MTPRRPVRAWIGKPHLDPDELAGPSGLTEEVLRGDADLAGPEPDGDDAFWESLLTPQRLGRIDAVVAARLRSVTVVLDRLLDAHNVAAVLRSAEGLGLSRVHVVPHDARDDAAHRRVTQDAHKWLDVEMHASGAEAARALAGQGFAVYAGHLDPTARPYTGIAADRPVALLFGNEHEGPSAETLSACAGAFRIPMAGFTQSFNVSVAAGIALSQICAARRAFLRVPGDLPPEERRALRSRFLRLAAKLARRVKR
ncbi:MAG: TrmH family RNA methyltransferase [Myxococcales bacterium]